MLFTYALRLISDLLDAGPWKREYQYKIASRNKFRITKLTKFLKFGKFFYKRFDFKTG